MKDSALDCCLHACIFRLEHGTKENQRRKSFENPLVYFSGYKIFFKASLNLSNIQGVPKKRVICL